MAEVMVDVLDLVKSNIHGDVDRVDALGIILTRCEQARVLQGEEQAFLKDAWALHEVLLQARNTAEKGLSVVSEKCARCDEEAEPGKTECWICLHDTDEVAPVEQPINAQLEWRRVRGGGYDYIMAGNHTVCVIRVPYEPTPAQMEAHEKYVKEILEAPALRQLCEEFLAELDKLAMDEDDPFLPIAKKGHAILDRKTFEQILVRATGFKERCELIAQEVGVAK